MRGSSRKKKGRARRLLSLIARKNKTKQNSVKQSETTSAEPTSSARNEEAQPPKVEDSGTTFVTQCQDCKIETTITETPILEPVQEKIQQEPENSTQQAPCKSSENEAQISYNNTTSSSTQTEFPAEMSSKNDSSGTANSTSIEWVEIPVSLERTPDKHDNLIAGDIKNSIF